MSNVINIWMTVLLTVIGNVLIYWVSQRTDVSLLAQQIGDSQFAKVTLIQVVNASVVTALLAGIGYFILSKISKNAPTIFLWIASILGFLSLIPLLFMAVDRPTFWVLGLMHVVSTLFITYMFAVKA